MSANCDCLHRYGCWNLQREAPADFRMSWECRYDMSHVDDRCYGCHEAGNGRKYDAAVRQERQAPPRRYEFPSHPGSCEFCGYIIGHSKECPGREPDQGEPDRREPDAAE